MLDVQFRMEPDVLLFTHSNIKNNLKLDAFKQTTKIVNQHYKTIGNG